MTIDDNLTLTMQKDKFLAHNRNKQQFINLLSGHLETKNCQTGRHTMPQEMPIYS